MPPRVLVRGAQVLVRGTRVLVRGSRVLVRGARVLVGGARVLVSGTQVLVDRKLLISSPLPRTRGAATVLTVPTVPPVLPHWPNDKAIVFGHGKLLLASATPPRQPDLARDGPRGTISHT